MCFARFPGVLRMDGGSLRERFAGRRACRIAWRVRDGGCSRLSKVRRGLRVYTLTGLAVVRGRDCHRQREEPR